MTIADAFFMLAYIFSVILVVGTASTIIGNIIFRYAEKKEPASAATEDRQLSKTTQDYFNGYFGESQANNKKIS